MSAPLKAALKSFSRTNKSQIQRVVNFSRIQDAPFEHFQHFVVAPASPPIQTTINNHYKISQTKLGPLEQPKTNKNNDENVQPNQTSQPFFSESQLLAYDHRLEKFLINAGETTFWEAAEKLFAKQFGASEAAYWIDIPSIGVLYSPSQSLYSEYNKGIASSVYRSKTVFMTSEPTMNQNYDENIDGNMIPADCPTISFPVFNERNKVVGVMLCVRPQGSKNFGEEEEQFVAFFQHKFQIFAKWLLNQPVQEPMILDILQLHRITDLIPELTQRMSLFFNCRKCEIWSMDRQKKKLVLYDNNEAKEIQIQDAGIAGHAIETEMIVNTYSNLSHQSYNSEIDGIVKEAVIAVPVIDSSNRYISATVLRGPMRRPIFATEDEDCLKNLSPFISLALANSVAFSRIQTEFEKSTQEREGLAALLEVAEILSGQLDTERLCEIIMEKGRFLTKADRCSLFLVSQTRDHLITSFHRGLKNCIDIPITKGIVGRTVTEAKVMNIRDAYEDPNFDNTTDVQTGYRTKSILSVPIFTQRGEVMGVTEMINKINGESFTKWDTNLIQIFNVFCGISLENARLYKESLSMSSQLRSFFGISLSFAKSEETKHLISDILRHARRALDSRRATVFLADDGSSQFNSFIVDGGKIPANLPLTQGIIGACYKTKEGIICNNAYSDSRFNNSVDQITGFKTVSLCAVPLIEPTGKILGVLELVNKIHGGFREKDLRFLTAIATFVSVALEKSRLKEIVHHGNVEVEIPKLMTDAERKETTIPVKLQLTDDQINKCTSLDFFSIDWDGLNLVKLLFYLFNSFHLLETFNVSNETFFRFIYEMRKTYKQVPYHNWIHACDVSQYASYELRLANADKIFTPLELFSLLTATVCHDANHDGFNNIYNLKAETPLGILFKEQSVMETHHCSVSIGIMTLEECNLMASLSATDCKLMWNWMIKLILATDMAHHFNLVKEASELLDKKEFSFENPDHRILAMQLLLKTADISNVSRPFTLADKWCDVLCEEFFRQGDNEKNQGIGLTSPLNDRENSNKPKSQIGFYNFICIPLYQAVARIFPDLEVNLNSVKSNLEVWKAMIAPKAE